MNIFDSCRSGLVKSKLVQKELFEELLKTVVELRHLRSILKLVLQELQAFLQGFPLGEVSYQLLRLRRHLQKRLDVPLFLSSFAQTLLYQFVYLFPHVVHLIKFDAQLALDDFVVNESQSSLFFVRH